jgi:hypothetical protein
MACNYTGPEIALDEIYRCPRLTKFVGSRGSLQKMDEQRQNPMSQSQERTMDPKQFALQLADEGFDEVLTKTLPAKQQLAAHTHPFDVKALVTDGQVVLGVGGQLTTYRVGDVFTMARNCEHTELYGDDGVSYLVGRRHH